jgi:hypothetical protein
VIGAQGTVATIALILILPFTLFLFAGQRPGRAAALATFGVVLFAPELAYFKLPSLPQFTKETIPYFCIILGALMQAPRLILRGRFGFGPEVLAIASLVGTIFTANGNKDVLVYGSYITTVLPGMSLNDGLAMGMTDVFKLGIPFFVGRALFKTSRDLEDLVRVIVGYGVVYCLFIAVELRLSPQMHSWVYGYVPHQDFLQVLRWGGYRPVVFMTHGLALALMMFHVTVLATALAKVKITVWKVLKPKTLAAGLFVVLILCKSTGAILFGFMVVPLVWFGRVKSQLRFATVVGVLALLYPALQAADLVPVRTVLSIAEAISPARAESLNFRFENEEVLLEKARERVLFGWGSYGRNSLYDPEMGKPVTITDGQWIILLGTRGVVGLVCAFGLALYPVYQLRKRLRLIADRKDQILLMALGLMVTMGVADLIPNSLFNNYPYFVAGALSGIIKYLSSAKGRAVAVNP